MSVFRNNPPAPRGQSDSGDRPARSESNFLTDPNPSMSNLQEPPKTFGATVSSSPDPRLSGQAGPTPPERCTNVIAAGAKWKGTLTVEDSVRVDGIFSGEVQSKGTVHVAEGAQMDAKIRAAYVVVAGTFSGEIRCDQRVDLLPRSRVSGEVITKILSVHEGATLDGRVQMTAEGGESQRSNGRSASRNGATAAPLEDRVERAASLTPVPSEE